MSDLINRHEAIDALKRDEEYDEDIPNRADGVRDAIITIIGLPSAQQEIIRCKDCLIHGVCRFEQGLGLDGYCSQAERRKDGSDR